MRRNAFHGFTLIELSIVLVIIGLLAGGVLVGKDLIKASQLRRITTERESLETAINTFRLKFNCLPGDCKNATQFFGSAGGTGLFTDAGCQTPAALNLGATGTCDGDGNRLIATSGDMSTIEHYGIWQHLALARLISGTYAASGALIGYGHRRGYNSPPSQAASNGMWAIVTFGDMTAVAGFYGGYGFSGTSVDFVGHSALIYGTEIYNSGGWYSTLGGGLTPREAFSIDQKTDDGLPFHGSIGTTPINAAEDSSWCSTFNTAYTSSAAAYNLSGLVVNVPRPCLMMFKVL
jgi:prepilin-type N-terminal cleavage/methylation domain-containing protein